MYGRGHEQGTRTQRKPARPWWADEEEANIRRVEAEWAARTAARHTAVFHNGTFLTHLITQEAEKR